MASTLPRAASKEWPPLNGANQLPRGIEGVKPADGAASDDAQNRAA